MLGINPRDGKAMYELQLELRNRADGKRPIISGDELLDLHLLLAQEPDLDFKRLFRKKS
jgi:hypothetical protein